MKNLIHILLIILFSILIFPQSGTWTELFPTSSPSARRSGSMARIGTNDVLLFGGNTGAYVTDTWRWIGNSGSWTQLSPASNPGSRSDFKVSRIDDDEILYFGGYNGAILSDETWRWNNSSEEWTELVPPNAPSGRRFVAMSRISDGEVLLFGGDLGGSNRSDETWKWNNISGSWTQINPPISPSGRYGSGMARINDNEIILFGGYDNSGYNGETWIWNNTSGSWTQLNPPSNPPAVVYSKVVSLDDDELLFFGGYDGSWRDQSWIWNNTSSSWTQLSPTTDPDARNLHYMSKVEDNIALMFGGNVGGTIDNDTWQFNFTGSVEAPTINSFDVDVLTATSTSFYSTVEPGGLSSTISFEYGTSSGNYSSTTNENTVSGNSNVSVGVTETGLTNSQVYYYRTIAENSEGIVFSSEGTFTQTSEPPAHSNLFSALAISSETIEFNIQSAASAGCDGYIILYKLGSSLTGEPVDDNGYSVGNTIGDATVGAIITSENSTVASVTGLIKNNQYHFKLFPFNYDGSDLATSNFKTDGSVPSLTTQTVPILGNIGMTLFVLLILGIGFYFIRARF